VYFQNEFYKQQWCAILVKNLILTTKYFFSRKNFFCSGLWNCYFCLNWLVVLTWNQNFLKQTKTLIEGEIGVMWLTLQGPLRWGTPAPPSGPRAHPARRSSCQDLMGHRTRGKLLYKNLLKIFMGKVLYLKHKTRDNYFFFERAAKALPRILLDDIKRKKKSKYNSLFTPSIPC